MIFVASCGDDEHAGVCETRDSSASGRRVRPAKAHVGDSATTLLGEPVHALDDVRGTSRSVAAQHSQRCDVGALGYAELRTGRSSRHMGAVTVAIRPVAWVVPNEIPAAQDSALEVHVAGIQTGVNHIHRDTTAVSVVGIAAVEG